MLTEQAKDKNRATEETAGHPPAGAPTACTQGRKHPAPTAHAQTRGQSALEPPGRGPPGPGLTRGAPSEPGVPHKGSPSLLAGAALW